MVDMRLLILPLRRKVRNDLNAHLIQGSSDGRFTITYCTKPENLSKEEINSVGYEWMDYNEAASLYNPDTLKEGWNTLENGEEIYFVKTPALGLWKVD